VALGYASSSFSNGPSLDRPVYHWWSYSARPKQTAEDHGWNTQAKLPRLIWIDDGHSRYEVWDELGLRLWSRREVRKLLQSQGKKYSSLASSMNSSRRSNSILEITSCGYLKTYGSPGCYQEFVLPRHDAFLIGVFKLSEQYLEPSVWSWRVIRSDSMKVPVEISPHYFQGRRDGIWCRQRTGSASYESMTFTYTESYGSKLIPRSTRSCLIFMGLVPFVLRHVQVDHSLSLCRKGLYEYDYGTA